MLNTINPTIKLLDTTVNISLLILLLTDTPNIGYEPADLTVHPPPQNDRGWVNFFRMGV